MTGEMAAMVEDARDIVDSFLDLDDADLLEQIEVHLESSYPQATASAIAEAAGAAMVHAR